MKKDPIVKIIFTACRQPGIVEHNIVGWLFNPTMMPLEKAFEYVRKFSNISEDAELFIYRTDAEIIETNADEDGFDREIKMSNVFIGPGKSNYALITRSSLVSMYPVDLDGDTISVSNVEEIVSGLPELQPERYYTGRGAYNVRNKWLQPMKHHAFDRDQLTKLFNDHIASNDKAFETLEDAIAGTDDHEVGDFRCWKDSDEEFYILHVPSGTIVGWYKFYHYGRDNFTNRDMTIDDLKEFFVLLRNQLLDEPDEPDEPRHPQVKVTEVDKSEVGKRTLTKVDIEKASHRLTINSIYGTHGLDPVSMYPMPPKSVDMENAWNVVKQWAKEHFHLSETNHIKCTVTSKSGKDNVWLIRHHDFIQLMGDTGDEIFIGYMKAEYSHKDEYGRRTCIQDQIRFENPIIDKFYQDFFANGPVREEYDFYKKTAGGW